MNLAAILAILQLAGAETPAFIALFNQVKPLFSATDQATLQEALRAAIPNSAQAFKDTEAALAALGAKG